MFLVIIIYQFYILVRYQRMGSGRYPAQESHNTRRMETGMFSSKIN